MARVMLVVLVVVVAMAAALAGIHHLIATGAGECLHRGNLLCPTLK